MPYSKISLISALNEDGGAQELDLKMPGQLVQTKIYETMNNCE